MKRILRRILSVGLVLSLIVCNFVSYAATPSGGVAVVSSTRVTGQDMVKIQHLRTIIGVFVCL